MNPFIAIVLASLLSLLGYQMALSPVLPIFAADLGALPEVIGVIVAASTITGVFFKLPSGALSDVLGRKRMMVLGAVFFARSEEHTSELQSLRHLVCRLLLEKKNTC